MPEISDGDENLLRLSNGTVDVAVSTSYGPRVLHAGLVGGENLMAQLPDAKLEWRPGADFSLRGGHRLWIAPEVPDLTYTPDNEAVDVEETTDGVRLGTAGAQSSPFYREMRIQLHPDRAQVRVTHRLTYEGGSTAVAAPWAITMLPPDGVVLLPMRRGAEGQLQADRNLVLWEYTKLEDPLLEFSDDAIVVRGGRSSTTKVGTSGSAGWSAYVRGSTALIKRAATDASANYPDKGAALQCYANRRFMELETLGPLRTLGPGDTTEHIEDWEFRQLDTEADAADHITTRLREVLDD